MKSVTIKEYKKIFNDSIASDKRYAHVLYQYKNFKTIRNHLHDYAEENGLYFVELDEFTFDYIEDVAKLYAKMSENDYCIIYVCLPNIVDYTTKYQQLAIDKLTNVVMNKNYNMQIVIDIHCISSNIPTPSDFTPPIFKIATILDAPIPLDLCINTIMLDIK